MRNMRYGLRSLIVGAFLVALSAMMCAGVANAAPIGGKTDASAAPAGREKATLAAGCFWCLEAIYQQLRGVDKVVPGYSGGTYPNPSYEQVETGNTGHAETVDITYDPKVISYSKLVEVLLTVRDPTTLNRQGPDQGTQYRSIIFYRNETEHHAALDLIQKITAEHLWPGKIVTEVRPFKQFYRAEDYHLNYYNLHPDQPYCSSVIAPEIATFRARFKAFLKN